MPVYKLEYTIEPDDGAFERVNDYALIVADSVSEAREAIDIQVEPLRDDRDTDD